jgi:hypothetical protein
VDDDPLADRLPVAPAGQVVVARQNPVSAERRR